MALIQPGNAVNVVTEFRYGPGGQLVELIARNPETGDQVTRYEYGVTLADSEIASNDLLRAEVYPDSNNSTDRVTYSYNKQGQRTKITDQNGSVHEYDYDALGRQTADKVTTLASGVDGAVRRIGQTFEVRGMVEKVTSYSDAAGTTVVNQVQNAYNDFGQLTTQYQEHTGAVNTGTTPKVQYAYADGSANTIRPISMTYPNGRVLEYRYDDTAADKLSRIRTLRWDGVDVCQHTYLGFGTFITTDYVEPQVKLNYALGSGANPYTGFDRFGRIIDLLWAKYGGTSSELVHLKYGYDQASNRTHREDLVAQSFNKDFDELYEYDGMQRLKKFHRGRLTADKMTITSPNLQQGWQLDATGNWQNFTQNDQVDAAQTLDQQRIANRVNEITEISCTVGPNWATPSYDRNGNMTVIPQPKDMTTTFQGTWDAWNRLILLKEPNGSGGWQTLQENSYDGQTWRTVVKTYAAGTLSETRHAYFTSGWQNIEERLGTSPQTAPAYRQFLWGLRYIDDIILRDTTATGPLDERLYAMQDANWNVTTLFNQTTSGIVERYAYTSYGVPLSLSPSYVPNAIMPSGWEVLFAGYYFDPDCSLNFVRHRKLNSSIGNWISRDPIQFDGINLYRLVHNSPINLTDPSGLSEHHWLPQLGGRGQVFARAKCTKVLEPNIDIHDFTTELGPFKGKLNDPARGPHAAAHFIDNDLKYNDIALMIYTLSPTCCDMLIAFSLLYQATWKYLQGLDIAGRLDPHLPIFEMHRYGAVRPWNDTEGKLSTLTKEACKKNDSKEKPCPVSIPKEILDKIQEIRSKTNIGSPHGISPTGDETLLIFLILLGPLVIRSSPSVCPTGKFGLPRFGSKLK